MHYHLIEPVTSKATLMEVEKAIWLFYDSHLDVLSLTDFFKPLSPVSFLFCFLFKYYFPVIVD